MLATITPSATPVAGGYLLSGEWPFASNCDNAEWAFISAHCVTLDGIAQGVLNMTSVVVAVS